MSDLSARHEALGAIPGPDSQGAPLHYGDPSEEVRQLRESVGLIDLSHQSVFQVNCPEARRWGNGMFTNNIKHLSEGQGNRNAMCDDRGRVLGLLDLYFNHGEQFVVVLDGVDRDWFEKHYRMYLILDDVELEPEAIDAPRLLSLQGPTSDAILEGMGWELPDGDRSHLLRPDGVRVCRRGRSGLSGFDLLVPVGLLESLWDQLRAAGATPVGTEALERLRILHGEAQWPRDGQEKTLIHQLRLEAQVCSFNKGCYLGQEVINRIDVKGAVNKRITGMCLQGNHMPPVSSDVLQDGKAIGQLTSVMRHGDQYIGLGILRKTAWEPGTSIQIETEDGHWAGETVELPLS